MYALPIYVSISLVEELPPRLIMTVYYMLYLADFIDNFRELFIAYSVYVHVYLVCVCVCAYNIMNVHPLTQL